jgi:hemerythrin
MKETALDWFFDNIKSHFEHDGDLMESVTFAYAIAKDKERKQIEDIVLKINNLKQ